MSGKKIMIIDDELDLVNLVRMRLQRGGYKVVYLDSGVKALEKAKSEKPDLILLDIMMPDKDGCDVCYELKHDEATSSIPVLIFSAKPQWSNEIQDVSKFVAADDFIYKPFEPEELFKKIERLLQR